MFGGVRGLPAERGELGVEGLPARGQVLEVLGLGAPDRLQLVAAGREIADGRFEPSITTRSSALARPMSGRRPTSSGSDVMTSPPTTLLSPWVLLS